MEVTGRERIASGGSIGSVDDHARILKILSRGRSALRTLRWRISVTWLSLTVISAFATLGLVAGHFDDMIGYGELQTWQDICTEVIFDIRLLFPVLAPLEDDLVFMRCVLGFEVGLFALLRASLLLSLCLDDYAAWEALADHERSDCLFYFGRGCAMIAYALWAMCRRTPVSMQRWLRFCPAVYVLPEALQRCYTVSTGHMPLLEVRNLVWVPAALVLYVVLRPQAIHSLRGRLRRWMEARGAMRAAAAVACLIGQVDPSEALREARQRFCSVDVSRLTLEDLQSNAANPGLNDLAMPCKLGYCDAFVSHSWHDDASAKWKALQKWRHNFRATTGREPQVWFDKYCIDQNNIEADLRRLPICLSGCNSLLILCGPTYLSRLWCVLEIFTYIMMGGSIGDIEVALVLKEASIVEDQEAIVSGFQDFNASRCDCFNPLDKERILLVIEAAFGDLGTFNAVGSDS